MAAVANAPNTKSSGAPGVGLCVFCKSVVEGTKIPVSKEWLGRTVREMDWRVWTADKGSLTPEEKNALVTMKLASPFFKMTRESIRTAPDGTTVTFEPDTTTILELLEKGHFFKVHERVGDGGFAYVNRVSLGDRLFVAKYIRHEHHTLGRLSEHLIKKSKHTFGKEFQVGILASPSDYVTRPLFTINDPENCPVLIFPLATGTIDELIPKLTKEDLFTICMSIVKGLKTLEKHPLGPIVHQDLTTLNVLNWNGKKFTLNDFGVCEAKGARIQALFSIYRSPQHLNSTITVDSSIDMWAVGAILLLLLTGECFEHNISRREFAVEGGAERVTEALIEKHADRVGGLDPTGEIQKIVHKCLQFDPKKRASVDEVLMGLEAIGHRYSGDDHLASAAAGGGASKVKEETPLSVSPLSCDVSVGKPGIEGKTPDSRMEKKEEEDVKAACAAGDGK